jgi:translation initiation factor 1
MDNDWKKRLGVVYSTDPDFHYDPGQEEEQETLPPRQQTLYVSLDRKNRKGKAVTLIEGFTGTGADLRALGRDLRNRCGTGGSVKDGDILIQGDLRNRVFALLGELGYRVKRKGG